MCRIEICTQKCPCPAACCYGERYLKMTNEERKKAFPDAFDMETNGVVDFRDVQCVLCQGKAAYVTYDNEVLLALPPRPHGCPNLDNETNLCNLVENKNGQIIRDKRPPVCQNMPVGGESCIQARSEHKISS